MPPVALVFAMYPPQNRPNCVDCLLCSYVKRRHKCPAAAPSSHSNECLRCFYSWPSWGRRFLPLLPLTGPSSLIISFPLLIRIPALIHCFKYHLATTEVKLQIIKASLLQINLEVHIFQQIVPLER